RSWTPASPESKKRIASGKRLCACSRCSERHAGARARKGSVARGGYTTRGTHQRMQSCRCHPPVRGIEESCKPWEARVQQGSDLYRGRGTLQNVLRTYPSLEPWFDRSC